MRSNSSGPGRFRSALAVSLLGPACALAARGADDRGPAARPVVVGPSKGGEPVLLDSGTSADPGLSFRWFQTSGVPVELRGTDSRQASFTAPEGPTTLGFVLAVANSGRVEVAPISVSIAPKASPPRRPPDPGLRGVVGTSIRLESARVKSEKTTPTARRWLLLAGPGAVTVVEDSAGSSITPEVPGLYRFALVEAAAGRISDPELIDVAVAPPPPPSPATVASVGLASIEGGPARAADLAGIFDGVAERMSLYASYSEILHELNGRLELLLPAGPDRAAWVDRLIRPLSASLVAALRDAGCDLTAPGSFSNPLSDVQKKSIAGEFRSVASGLRSGRRPG